MTSLMTASLTISMLTEVAVTTSESSLRLTSFFYMKVSLADVLNVSNLLLYSQQRLSTWLKHKLQRKPFDYAVFLVKLAIFMMTMLLSFELTTTKL